jgi:toxin CptA
MHNAPAVSFPVGRSRFQAWFLSTAWLVGTATCVGWITVVDASGWRQAMACAMSMAAGAAAWTGWQRQTGGSLHWDGLCWRLDSSITGNLAVHLDFQNFLLLSLRLEKGGVRWLWIDRCAELAHWQAFRRAVHS